MARRKKTKGFTPSLLAAVGLAAVMAIGVEVALLLVVAGLGLYFYWSRYSAQQRREKLCGYSLEEIDQLTGAEFEQWVTTVLESAGMPSENIRHSGDFGVDVVTTVGTTRVGIQAKRYSSSVGNSSVQQALAGSGYHGCELAAVVTQSRFTSAAREQASRARVPVLLIDRENIHDLAGLVREFAGG
jgi:restriction system protein